MSAPPNAAAGPAAAPQLPDLNGLGRNDFRARSAYSEGAGIFRIVPAAVVIPSTTGALRELVLWAARRRVPLVPRGAGSGMAGGNLGPGVIVDLTVLDGCTLEIRPQLRRAYTAPGVPLQELNAEAALHGLRLPPNPSSGRFATLGGMVSTNASGPGTVRAGSVRHWVEAAELITADGETLTLRRGVAPRACRAVERFLRDAEPALRAGREVILARFPKTRKNSSGYALDAWLASGDLLDLIIGSEGTLGFVTGIEWRLVPVPAHRAGLRAALRTIESLGDLIPELLALDPSAVEFLDATFLSFVGQANPVSAGLLMVEFEGDESDNLDERLLAARRILAPLCCDLVPAVEEKSLEELWAIRHAASPVLARLGEGHRSMQVIEDGCVPVGAIARYLSAVRAAGQRHGVELVIFGHMGDGNLHVNLLPDVGTAGWEVKIAAIFDEVSEVVVALGGTLSGEHGDGRLRARAMQAVYGPELVALFRLVKDAFDPVGIMNPGVKLALAEEPPFASLKVGTAAAPIPADIEAALRGLERNAGYAVSRLELADEPEPPHR